MDYKAVIFDLDGTLLDSMNVWKNVDEIFFMSRNMSMPEDYLKNIQGLSLNEVANYTKNLCNLEEDVEKIINEWTEIAYNQYKTKVKLKDGAYDYLLYLLENGIKIGIATTCPKKLYEVALKANKVYDFFSVIIDTEQIYKGKNYPDIYLHCAQKLGVFPSECIVFEDILEAICTVKKAGMQAYAVYEKHSIDDIQEIFLHCDEYITDFREMILK